jgi:hypothetical protein
MSPRICPPPPQPDCPLYAQRLPYGIDEPLRRAILRERNRPRSMAALVWADLNRQRPPTPPLELPVLPPGPPRRQQPSLFDQKEVKP